MASTALRRRTWQDVPVRESGELTKAGKVLLKELLHAHKIGHTVTYREKSDPFAKVMLADAVIEFTG